MTERAHNPYHGFPGGRPAWPTATWQQRAGTEANKPNAETTRMHRRMQDARVMVEREDKGLPTDARNRSIALMRRRG